MKYDMLLFIIEMYKQINNYVYFYIGGNVIFNTYLELYMIEETIRFKSIGYIILLNITNLKCQSPTTYCGKLYLNFLSNTILLNTLVKAYKFYIFSKIITKSFFFFPGTNKCQIHVLIES